MAPPWKFAAWGTLLYLAGGAVWVALGDALLALLVSDPLWLARLQTLKGWLYVLLTAALASPNPAFIDVVVEREENVYPIVPAGAALDEMLLV